MCFDARLGTYDLKDKFAVAYRTVMVWLRALKVTAVPPEINVSTCVDVRNKLWYKIKHFFLS